MIPPVSPDTVVDLFQQALPFHFAFNAHARIAGVGPSLAKVCPSLRVGDAMDDYFTVERPAVKDFSELFAGDRHDLCLVRVRDRDLRLRGQLLGSGTTRLFVGSPWLCTLESLAEAGLELSDFAPHDSLVDNLFL